MPAAAIEYGLRAVAYAFEKLHITDCALETTGATTLASLDLRLAMEVSQYCGISLAMAGKLLYRFRWDRQSDASRAHLLRAGLINFLTLIGEDVSHDRAGRKPVGVLVGDEALLMQAARDKGRPHSGRHEVVRQAENDEVGSQDDLIPAARFG